MLWQYLTQYIRITLSRARGAFFFSTFCKVDICCVRITELFSWGFTALIAPLALAHLNNSKISD